MYEVSSEIYAETDFQQIKTSNGRIISKFKFYYPLPNDRIEDNNDDGDNGNDENEKHLKRILDDDGDLIVPRKKYDIIEIEHLSSTTLQLVGLQVWRGSLLLCDFLFNNTKKFMNKKILELGAGCGLTSIAAGIILNNNIICSDINVGGILNLIQTNLLRNQKFLKNSGENIQVMEIDFTKFNINENSELKKELDDVEIVIAADVIYDDDLTDHFINVLDKLLTIKYKKSKTIYIALEKRYVFTFEDLETTAPCYHYFITKITSKQNFNIKNIQINELIQYFQYERCKELVLLEITKK